MSQQAGTTDRFNFKCPPPKPGKQTNDVDIKDVCTALYDVITWLNGVRDVLCACDRDTLTINPDTPVLTSDYTEELVQTKAGKKKKKKGKTAKAAAKKKTTRKKATRKTGKKKGTSKATSRRSNQ